MAYKGIPTLCIPHNSAGVIEAPDRDVKVGAPANFVALNGDPCPCAVGGPDLIMAGMTDIVVGDVPVAGWMHHTSHNTAPPLAPIAMVEWGDTWILMGGGTTVGNVQASLAACRCLQAGRANKSPNQSGQNCGVESMRQIINAKRRREGKAELSEDELLNDTLQHGDSYVTPDKNAQWDATLIEKDNAVKKARARLDAAEKSYQDSVSVWNANQGDAAKLKAAEKARQDYKNESRAILVDERSGALIGTESDLHEMADGARERQKERAAKAAAASDFKDQDRYWAGGTLPEQQRKVLDRHGIPTTEVSQDPSEPQNMKDIEDAVGQGKGVVVGMKAGPLWGTNAGGDHAILVTGVSYDESGQVVGYITNDTAMGCGRRVPKDQFRGALRPELKATVTRDPVW